MLGLCHWVVKIRALRDRWPFWAACFGRFAGLPSEDLQQHAVIYLIVLGFAATGIAAMLFFCDQTNAGDRSSRDPQKSATGTAPQATGKAAAKQNSVTVRRA